MSSTELDISASFVGQRSGASDLNRAYAGLRQVIESEGLLDKTPRNYLWQTILALSTIATGFALLGAFENLTIHIGAALILSIGVVQAALVGHDIAHRQVFRSQQFLSVFGVIFWNFILGASFRYWTHKHDRHHAHPNHIGKDPDLGAPFLFSHSQLGSASRFRRWSARYQKIYFFLILALAYFSVVENSIRYLAKEKLSRSITIEWLLFVFHFVAFFTLFGFLLDWPRVFLLTLIHYVTMGIYLGLIFAPNHKGLRIYERDESLPHAYRQVVSSRNIRPHPLVDYFFGGLNYQIEHHLFPTMPRAHLKRARELVRSFTTRESLPYQELNFVGAFCAIYRSFFPLPGLGWKEKGADEAYVSAPH